MIYVLVDKDTRLPLERIEGGVRAYATVHGASRALKTLRYGRGRNALVAAFTPWVPDGG